MKKNIPIIAFIVLTCMLVSCETKYTGNKTIIAAEKLLDTSPDSAYILLTGISHPEKMPDADYAAWCLNYTHACYKLQKKIKSDSLINFAIDYYKKTKLFRQSGTAYYLYGCILSFRTENDKAILALKQAEGILAKTNENKLKGLVAYNIGHVCLQDELYYQSLNYFRKSLKYFRLCGNKKYAAYVYREISYMYFQLGYSSDSVMKKLDIALKLSQQAGDTLNYYYLLSRKGELLTDKDYKLSKQYVLIGFRHFPRYRYYYAAYLAYIYSKLNKQDSVKYYLSIALADSVKEIYKVKCYHAAAQIAVNRNDYKKAYEYMKQSYSFRDSTYQQNLRSKLYRIDKKYDLSEKERENTVLIIANRTKMIWITLLLAAVLFVSIILMFLNNRHKRNFLHLEMDRQQLKYEAEAIQQNGLQKSDMLLLKLNDKISNTLKFNKLKKTYLFSEEKEEFIEEITKQSVLSENEWKDYIDEVNNLFDNKIERLKQEIPELTLTDLIVIALICLKVNITNACVLLGMTTNTMYVRRKTIKKRLELDADIDLEEWLQDKMK